jgi:DNA-binding transcriptional regulator YhcF (GntR family)
VLFFRHKGLIGQPVFTECTSSAREAAQDQAMKFKEIKRKRIYEEVLVQLQEFLLNGNVVPGQKLPSERELAQTFNVNRVSVREALTVLEANGLVERKVGEGTFRTGAVNFEATPLIKAITNKERQVREPIQVRRVIEPQLARLAAQNISEEQLEVLRDILRRQEERLKQGKDIHRPGQRIPLRHRQGHQQLHLRRAAGSAGSFPGENPGHFQHGAGRRAKGIRRAQVHLRRLGKPRPRQGGRGHVTTMSWAWSG